MIRSSVLLLFFCAVIMGPGLAGCGSKTQSTAKLTGKVTLDGKPVKAGTVRVVSEGNKAAALGQIDENGEYLVSNAPIGKVQIALTKPEVPTGLDPTKGAGGQPDIGKGKDRLSKDSSTLPNIGLSADQVKSLQERAKTIENMPAIYSDPQKSGLTTTVVEGGASYDIIMKSK